jgi:hypothetical protein
VAERRVNRSLAERQAELVTALVAGGPPPAGFDQERLRATTEALLRKRAGEVGERWPALRIQFGPQWTDAFAAWARDRPPQGSLRDGWDLARTLADRGTLGPLAAVELAQREAAYHYDGTTDPRPRRALSPHRALSLNRAADAYVVRLGSRMWTIRPRRLRRTGRPPRPA